MRIRPWYAIQILALAVVYVAAARAGLMMDAVAGFATLVWPGTGIAIAALFVLGLRMWPGVLVGAVVANVWTGAPIAVAAGIAIGNTLEGLFGAYALRRANFRRQLDRVRDALVLIALAAACAPLVSATVGVASLWLGDVVETSALVDTWRAWWLGDAVGALVVTPVLLTLARPARDRALESSALVVVLGLTGVLVFGGRTILPGLQLPYVVFPPLVWAALRFGARGAARATFVMIAIAIAGTALQHGPFASETLAAALLSLQAFMVVVAITILLLGSASAERDDAVRKREELMEVISHELKNPISSVQLSSEVLLKLATEDSVRKRVVAIQRAGDRMTTLIQNVLDLRALERGRIAIEPVEMQAVDLVEEAAELLRPLAAERAQTIEIASSEKHAVFCDRDRVLQIFANLVGNAMKFSPRSSVIELALVATTGHIQFSVRDRGPGLAPEERARVFDRYWQAPKTAQHGSGLGLFICKGLVEAHGGSIWVESEPGSGSVFHFTLPKPG